MSAATVAAPNPPLPAELLCKFRLNGTLPFDSVPREFAISVAEEAHALCIVLSSALTEGVTPGTEDVSLRPRHIARAVDAIGTLIAMSLFAGENA